MKKVSVIVPMYKAKPYVKPCVDALLRQGVEEDELEILLIDDRSPDDTFAYAKDLFGNCPAVRVIEQEQNGGPGKARNRGLQEAAGKYICFADVDDLYIDNAISGMIATAEAEHADVVHTNGVYFTIVKPLPDDLSVLGEQDLLSIVFSRSNRDAADLSTWQIGEMEERLRAWYHHDIHWNVWGKLYKKDFLDRNGIRFLDMKIGEDCLFVMKCMLTAEKYVQNNTFTYIYRIGESQSVSRGSKNPKVFINAQMSLFEIEQHFEEELGGIPYLKEHPQELQKLKEMEISNIRGPYAIAKYAEIGRSTLSEDPGVKALFETYFGADGERRMNALFDEYDQCKVDRSAEVFSSYEFWKSIRDRFGSRVFSLNDLSKK